MNRVAVWSLMLAILASTTVAAEETFTTALSPTETEAAGLSKLTPAERQQLDALVERYRSGALAVARKEAAAALAEKQAAQEQAAKAEAKAAAAHAEVAKAQQEVAAVKAASPSFLAKTKGLLGGGKKAPPQVIESTVPGKFRGWGPRHVFVLANGQQWQVSNDDSYYSPLIENPRVEITPAALTGYWMRFPDLGTQVRVRLLNGE